MAEHKANKSSMLKLPDQCEWQSIKLTKVLC